MKQNEVLFQEVRVELFIVEWNPEEWFQHITWVARFQVNGQSELSTEGIMLMVGNAEKKEEKIVSTISAKAQT